MELSTTNKSNFWDVHTLNDFEPITFLKNVHSSTISSVCFLKDGRIASSSLYDGLLLIYNKITYKIEIKIIESKSIYYMNVTRDGMLITCLGGIFVNLYEINGKEYKIIQTIKPYSFLMNIIAKYNGSFSIQKFIELKNGDLVFFAWCYGLSFYRKKKNSKKYSYFDKYKEPFLKQKNITDLVELDNDEYVISFQYEKIIQFLKKKSKKITKTIKCDFSFSDSKSNMLLMNKNDLFLLGDEEIFILDIQKKEIIKEITLKVDAGDLSSIYKLSDNILLAGYQKNSIVQLEYDEIKKEFKVISKNSKKDNKNSALYETSSIAILKNNLIAAPFNNDLFRSSLIIYKYKYKY